ncbi:MULTISPECIES: AAA family ATPase [Marinobacter]|uniref:AAA family ATPase n=1 Tax=Marinobacter sp. TaxID=50741 RepID=UPI0029C414D2|nr:AAA family ATPase [Marinobacter sp.]MDX5385351.1 AAA family ATPase [Marinobacter sp.]MDX5439841.1 AAA family ATPase [Alteromonadaceae bacterium]
MIRAGSLHRANGGFLILDARRILTQPMASAGAVARVIREEGASQLVLSRQCSLFREQGADTLLIEMNLPVTVTP